MLLTIVMVVGLLPLSVLAEDMPIMHTVKFILNYNGAHSITSQKVADGECATQPENVTREGWIFDYWYTKGDNGSERFDLNQPVTKDMTLKARWKEDVEYWGPIWNRGIINAIEHPKNTGEKEEPSTDGVYTVTFEDNGDWAVNLPAAQKVKAGECPVEPAEPTREGYIFVGWHIYEYPFFSIVDYFDFQNERIDNDITLYAIWESEQYDHDGDVSSYKEELDNKTDPFLYDTDNDGLSDGDEVNIYHTDPLNPDTDQDGVIDGDEVSFGLNSLESKTDGKTNDSERKIEKTFYNYSEEISLTLCTFPSMLHTVMKETLDKTCIENTDRIISPVIEIYYYKMQDFDYTELVYDYSDADLTGIDETDLTFLYLNKSTGLYKIVLSTADQENKLVIAQPMHFSAYVVGTKNATAFTLTDSEMKVIADTGFDVKRYAFAFHNPRNGMSAGITYVALMNYLNILPLHTDYSSANRYNSKYSKHFITRCLYYDEEANIFKNGNKYYSYEEAIETGQLKEKSVRLACECVDF